jgi:hypothetical protein
MEEKGITISEIVKKTGLRRNTVEVRLHRLGIKPIVKEIRIIHEARYPDDTLEKIEGIKMGRPKKPATEAPSKPRKPKP